MFPEGYFAHWHAPDRIKWFESPYANPNGDIAFQIEYAFLLSESMRPGNHSNPPPPIPDIPAMFTTYHPLLVESHFSVLICQLMLADFAGLLPTFIHTAGLVDGLEGYPIFLPPRSMGQAEFIEILERLSSGWKIGIQPHSLSTQRGKSRLAIEGYPAPPVSPIRLSLSKSGTTKGIHQNHSFASSSSSSSRKNSVAGGSSSNFNDVEVFPDTQQPSESNEETLRCPSPVLRRADAVEALDCARILLAPVVKRQRERLEKAVAEKAGGGLKKKPMPINIPLHGPRVEVVLAWLGAIHLPELDMT